MTYDILIDNEHKTKVINEFVKNIQNNINNIDTSLRNDFIEYNINILKQKIGCDNNLNNLLNYFFEIKKIAGDYSLNKIHKLKYFNNNCDIVLIAQYYNTSDEQRQKENTVSLINNILNPYISKIHLLNEELYDLDFIFKAIGEKYRNKIKQCVIEKRMTYHDAMAYSNKFCKNNIIIVANLDIFFNEDLNKLQSYDFTDLFLSLSRYEMLNDYEFGGNNQVAKFIHNGQLGNPCIDSHDAWIFKTPIRMTSDSKIMLGSLGCDTIINYIYGVTMNYTVVNPIDSIMTIHYHRERERDYRTENSVRSHSGIIYNKDNKFNSDNYEHKYILQKSVLVCNTIESFCTFATKNAYKDLRLLLHSLEIYHKDIPIFIYCDDFISEKIDKNNFNLQIYKKNELNHFTNLNRKSMEEQNIFTEFLLNKANVIDYAMQKFSNTLFIDADIVILNKLDLLIDSTCDVGLSPHNIFESSQKMFGIYNAGFMYVCNNKVTNFWRKKVYTKKGFVDQQALDYFEDEFKVYKFDTSYNFGWWRLFQCEDPQARANLFKLEENNIYYSYKTLKCIHTHLYDTNDVQTTQFNKFIINLLEKINHPILKFINNTENIENTEKIENIDKPTIIIPRMPRDDFWNHNNDTFRELLKLWKENELINLVEDDVKHVWYNKIQDILLYDRPTLDWFENDVNIKYNKILFGNPNIPDKLKNKAVNWIFWARSPRKLNYYANTQNLSFVERTIESIFIGKIENNIQAQYRLKYPNIEKSIELYIMHKPEEPYKYNQDEYLSLLKQSKFGLCLRGFGPKCNREIELIGLGTVPIVATEVDMSNYYDPLIENVHYFRFNNVDDIKKIIENCDENKWTKMSNACIEWYNKNCSIKGSFMTTQKIIKDFDKLINIKKATENLESINKVKYIDDISANIIFSFGEEQQFDRNNLKSYFSINHIYEHHIKKYNNIKWDNINKFIDTQQKYIAKFNNVKINNDGVMYDDKYIYRLNNININKEFITNKELYTFDENCIVFNCIQKNGLNYNQWLCEVYPRLLHIKLFIENNSDLFVNKSIILLLYFEDNFIKQYLEILNLKNVTICPYDANIEYYCNTLYLYTPTIYENPSKDSIDIIRRSLFNNSVCVPKINILIKSNTNNIISNFDNMYNLLKENYSDYQWIIYDETNQVFNDIIKTIQLFSQANLIVGSHDSGLTNMIFASSDCKILELHPENCGNMYYWHLSNILQNNHTILSVKNIPKSQIVVNLEQLDYTVNKLLDDIFNIDNI